MDSEKEEKINNKKTTKQKGFWDLIVLPFKAIGLIFSFLFKSIKVIKKIVSVILLIFIIWFGYNFYVAFSQFTESGVDKETAAIEAFNTTLNSMVSAFERIPRSIDIKNPFLRSYTNEENIRELFIETRGMPEAYVLIISYDKIKEGVPIKRENPLQFEVWFYGDPYNNKVVFENGFFKEEKRISATDDFIGNSVNPLIFNEGTSKSMVQSIFGTPSCTLTEKAGEDVLTTYRFKETNNTPLAAVTFVNEKLISVTAGIVFLSDNEEQLCK